MSSFARRTAVRAVVFSLATLLAVVLGATAQQSAPQVREVDATGPVQAPFHFEDGLVLRPRPLPASGSAASESSRAGSTRTQAGQKTTQKSSKSTASKSTAGRTTAGKATTKARQQASRQAASRSATRRAAAARPSQWGRDISWPQCPTHVGIPDLKGKGLPLPPATARFVVIGLTNGRAFTENPCLADHLRWAKRNHAWASAYTFATYPTKAQLRRFAKGPYPGTYFYAKLRNAAYAMARYNIRSMQRHGFKTPHVWLDVEPSSSRPWSGRPEWNREVVVAWVRAYRDAGYSVGVYSTKHLWQQILGNARFGLPEWRTVGPDSPAAAARACTGESFQGGHAVLAQRWTTRVDHDLLCSRFLNGPSLRRFFHKY